MERAQQQVAIKAGVFTRPDFDHRETALRGSRCAMCTETFFPHRSICPRCRSGQRISEVSLSRTGKIHTFTAVERTPGHYSEPYVLGKVDLPEGVRILTQIERTGELRIGMEVELVIEPMFDNGSGARVWGYRFRALGPA